MSNVSLLLLFVQLECICLLYDIIKLHSEMLVSDFFLI